MPFTTKLYLQLSIFTVVTLVRYNVLDTAQITTLFYPLSEPSEVNHQLNSLAQKLGVLFPGKLRRSLLGKPFTNAMKKHILDTLKENNQNLPENSYLKRKRKDEENRRNRDYLLSLFEENDDDFIFLGFDTQS